VNIITTQVKRYYEYGIGIYIT